METNMKTNEVNLCEVYEAAKLFQVPGVTVSAGGGRISVSCDVDTCNSLPAKDAANLVARTSLAIGYGLQAMFPSRPLSREKFQGKNVGREGHWNMGAFHTKGLYSVIKIKLTEDEQNQLIWGHRI